MTSTAVEPKTRVRRLIEGNEVSVEPTEQPAAEVVDLLEALKASVEETRSKKSA